MCEKIQKTSPESSCDFKTFEFLVDTKISPLEEY